MGPVRSLPYVQEPATGWVINSTPSPYFFKMDHISKTGFLTKILEGSLWMENWEACRSTYFPPLALKGWENPRKHSGGLEENYGKYREKGPPEYETGMPTLNCSNQAAYRYFSEWWMNAALLQPYILQQQQLSETSVNSTMPAHHSSANYWEHSATNRSQWLAAHTKCHHIIQTSLRNMTEDWLRSEDGGSPNTFQET
jgi:hypothetical protein